MSKGYMKAKGRNGYKFAMLRHDIMDSAAWRSLKPPARVVWTEIVRRYNGENNGQIPLSTREAAQLCNISNDTAANAFNALIEAGFIKIGAYSDFRLKTRKSRRWILTHERLDDKPPTNEWRTYTAHENQV